MLFLVNYFLVCLDRRTWLQWVIQINKLKRFLPFLLFTREDAALKSKFRYCYFFRSNVEKLFAVVKNTAETVRKAFMLRVFYTLRACSQSSAAFISQKSYSSFEWQVFVRRQMFFCRFCFERKTNPAEASFRSSLKL